MQDPAPGSDAPGSPGPASPGPASPGPASSAPAQPAYETPPSVAQITRDSAAALWANRYPAIALQVFAIGIGGAYFASPAVRDALGEVADLKSRLGLLFAIVSTAIFGGAIPWLIQRLNPHTRGEASLEALAFLSILWGIKGIEVDLLYRGQAYLFGNNNDIATLAIKTAVDQGLYAPFWAVTTMVLAFQWRARGYRLRPLMAEVRRSGGLGGWFRRAALPVVLPNAAVWVPAVIVIYCLPLPLQLPIQNMVLCLWSVLLIVLAGQAEAKPS